MEKASDIPLLGEIFRQRIAQEKNAQTGTSCPVCRHPLIKEPFEKTKVYQCTFCGGTMIDTDKISRVLARSEGACPGRVKALARFTMKENQVRFIHHATRNNTTGKPLLQCPKCRNKMTRTFYSLAYLVEIDRCGCCNITWFDQDELIMLQCMIAARMASQNLVEEVAS